MPQSLSVYDGSYVQSSVRLQTLFASVTSLPSPSHSFLLSTILDSKRLNIPDSVRVLLDTSVAREEAHPSHTRNTLANPFILVLVRNVNQVMRLKIALEVIRNKVIVAMLGDASNKGREGSLIAKGTFLNGVEDLLQFGMDLVLAVVVCVTKIFHIFCEVAEEEDVLVACLACDFDL